MPYSTCCGAYTDMEEYGICPECQEHCEFEEEDEDEIAADLQTQNQIEEEQINKHLNK